MPMNRRSAIKQISSAVFAASVVPYSVRAVGQGLSQPFMLPELPYALDALEPYFDAETMHLHYQKHHQAYVTALNALVATEPKLSGVRIEKLLANLSDVPEPVRTGVRNFGGGHANHSLWWATLGKTGSSPSGELAKAIDRNFGSRSSFEEKLTKAALGVFGSGWAWLVKLPDGSLAIDSTANQDSPLSSGHRPLLGVDVWEHAYYLKYQNRRVDFVKAFLQVVNWDRISAQYIENA